MKFMSTVKSPAQWFGNQILRPFDFFLDVNSHFRRVCRFEREFLGGGTVSSSESSKQDPKIAMESEGSFL